MNESDKDHQKVENKVWIACRAKEGCLGNYAIIVFNQQLQSNDGLNDMNSGRMIRYQCCTCNGIFTVSH